VATDVLTEASAIASDHDAGAAELVARLLPLLETAIAHGPDLTRSVAQIVCAGQPAMASLWHACAAAIAALEAPGQFARMRAQLARAPAALQRAASLALHDLLDDASPQIVTLSFSSSLAAVLQDVARTRSGPEPSRGALRVVCGEGRPRFEGRRMAAALAAAGLEVTVATDAALTTCLTRASTVMVGADAIADSFWINKTGTHGLVSVANRLGVPVYVVASRDKAMPPALAARWRLPEAAAPEVWPDAPGHIRVLNRYFEPIPAELVTLFLTDAGPVAPEHLPAFVASGAAPLSRLLEMMS